MDEYDLRLLELLAENARLTNRELGEKLGLHAGSISRRVASLQERGIIERFTVDINYEKLGLGSEGLLVIDLTKNLEMKEIRERLKMFPNLTYVAAIIGRHDLHIGVVAKNPNEFVMTARRVMDALGSAHVESYHAIWNVRLRPQLQALVAEDLRRK